MNLALWRSWLLGAFPASGGDTHGFAQTNMSIDATTGRPLAGSPLIGAGQNLNSICSGQPNPGLGALCFDAAGTARPVAGAWDIGAYQFGSSPAPPIISMTPSPASFGTVNVGSTSGPVTITTSNTGGTSEALNTPHYTNTNPTEFTRTGGTCTDGGSIAAGSACTDIFTCTPTAGGLRIATMTINGTVSAQVNFTCNGVVPQPPTSAPAPVIFIGNSLPAQPTINAVTSP